MKLAGTFNLAVIVIGYAQLSALHGETAFEQDCAKLAAGEGNDVERLGNLFKLHWDYTMHENPAFATEVGYPGLNDRWADESLEAIERRKRELQGPLKVILSINRSKLSVMDRLNYDLFKKNQEDAIAGARFKSEYVPITQLSGPQQFIADVLEFSPHRTVQDYQDMISRLRAVPKLLDQTMVLLSKGSSAGITPPRITLREVPQQIRNQMAEEPEKNAFLRLFAEFPPEVSQREREQLRAEAQTVIKTQVLPAFGKLHEFFVNKYLPTTRESIALSDLPDGIAWYAYRVRTETTTALTPEQIHEIGLAEVKRIHGAMDQVIAQTGFKGSFAAFSKYLRTDPRFFYTDPNDLMRGYRDIAKRVDPELARLFGKLPRLTYGVKSIPAYAEASQTTAYYQPGAPNAGRPGWFFANTYALETRPKWEMEALTLHEAVPGHHLQIALAQEMVDVPEFRKHGSYTAFQEGWGLYSESLGTEMGFYQDAYMKFGQLTYEIWRAIRLVVDTGIHSRGWSRQQSIDYFLNNSSKTEHDVTVEVDRYIVWPGQALAYKIGELKIKELRGYATRELGQRFEIRRFHDQVLGNGALPLDLLEHGIKDWVVRESGK